MPPVILFDLDDTLLDTSGGSATCWVEVVARTAAERTLEPRALSGAIDRVRSWFWRDPERHCQERLDMLEAWRKIAEYALVECGVDARVAAELSIGMARDYAAARVRAERLFEDTLPTLERLRARGVRLGMVTNGGASMQRAKIVRHQLEPWFQSFSIEGEIGIGKPHRQAYHHALASLGAKPEDAWMVGDNLEWDIAGAQRVGIRAAYIDRRGDRLEDSGIRPDRVLASLLELTSPRRT